MGRRNTSSRIPTTRGTLETSIELTRRTPLHSTPALTNRNKTKTCLLDAILVSTEVDYKSGFKSLWMHTDTKTSAHVGFSLINGITSIVSTRSLLQEYESLLSILQGRKKSVKAVQEPPGG